MTSNDRPTPDGAFPGLADTLPQNATIEDLVEYALDAPVRTGAPAASRDLAAELSRRGNDALWEAALLLLGLLATRPVYGLGEHQGVERLRQVARTADSVTSQVLSTMAVHRTEGVAAARETWQRAPAVAREPALTQLLISAACVTGSHEGRLGPRRPSPRHRPPSRRPVTGARRSPWGRRFQLHPDQPTK
ncbi:hypothetical protein F7Q99_29820 [Streptomyces kaniharaensis]|uniref:Uncharacterized protein n=1 Tax=Streptomyces kaniharaensis TaxID=212423 RepID=A0A6N7KXC8_9ACTN|nr:hypothetical protein [Streptomyces kaniharaensis]MQS16302.1 hypothetical protein [Streptomyces kaniharaensis]